MYCLSLKELANLLNVTPSVIEYAQIHGTPGKRKRSFSTILKIPAQYFDKVTTQDFPEIEKCRGEFMKVNKRYAVRMEKAKQK